MVQMFDDDVPKIKIEQMEEQSHKNLFSNFRVIDSQLDFTSVPFASPKSDVVSDELISEDMAMETAFKNPRSNRIIEPEPSKSNSPIKDLEIRTFGASSEASVVK